MEIKGPNQNIPPIGPGGPGSPGGTAGPDKTKGARFGESMSTGGAGQAAGVGATGGAGAAGAAAGISLDPVLAKLQSRIKEGVQAGEPKQQILESLIGEHLQGQFGSKATPQMTAAVTERFQTDPQLSQVFNRLYSQATK